MASFTKEIGEMKIYSPYQHVHTGSGIATMAPRTGVFDSISVYSDDNADDVTLTVIAMDGTTTTGIQVTSGNTLFGPFTSYDITGAAGTPNVTVVATERCGEFIEKEWNYSNDGFNSPTTGLGYLEGVPDGFKLPTYGTAIHDEDFLEMNVTVNAGTASTGLFTLDDAEIASIDQDGQILFQNATVFQIGMTAAIKYRIRK
tara:strand:- start:16 stop:618 length:603 start_codon:yes stop_codon:yes gene_type:complete